MIVCFREQKTSTRNAVTPESWTSTDSEHCIGWAPADQARQDCAGRPSTPRHRRHPSLRHACRIVAAAPNPRPEPLNTTSNRTGLRNRRLCFSGKRISEPEILSPDISGSSKRDLPEIARPRTARRMRAFFGYPENLWLAGSAWWCTQSCANASPLKISLLTGK
jgi:hypothetical protein